MNVYAWQGCIMVDTVYSSVEVHQVWNDSTAGVILASPLMTLSERTLNDP